MMVHVHLSYRKDAVTPERAVSVNDNFAHVLNVLTLKLRGVGRIEPIDKLLVNSIDCVSRNDYNRIVEFSAPIPQRLEDCIHDLILANCSNPANATRTAITAWDGSFTYAELAQQAFRLAAAIASAAAVHRGPGSPEQLFVPYFLTKSKWTPVALLAIWTAGGAVVPLEPTHPAARRNDILSQLQAPIIVTNTALHNNLAQSLDPHNGPVRQLLCVDGDYDATVTVPLPYVSPSGLCYVIFTSGSTGSPKGVKWEHATLATSTAEHGREFHFDTTTRVLQFASHVFDVSVVELVTPLVHGGCIVIPAESDRLEATKLTAFMERHGVNTALFAASFARLLNPAMVPTLRTLILGGEAIGQENLDKWTPALERFIIGYGSAETCINCSKNEFTLATRASHPWKESLGHAIGSRMLIADRHDPDKLAPIGAVGEILVEGPILAQGYLHDEAKTNKTHFYPAVARRRFYRMGDLGRQGTDGAISFMGRADFQVKIRGQRMELDEVRFHVVKAMPSAVDVHVDVISPVGDKGAGGEEVKMKETLRGSLPSAAVPTYFVPLASFPYLVSGKATIKQLSSYSSFKGQSQGLPQRQPTHRQTPGPTETILLQACREALKNPAFEMDDAFVASGGDSISAIKMASAARALGVTVTVADIINAPTLRDLASLAVVSPNAQTNTTTQADTSPEIPAPLSLLPPAYAHDITSTIQSRSPPHATVLDIYPATPLQEALLTASTLRPGAYVARHHHPLPYTIDLPRFQAAWTAILRKHDILRTRIYEHARGAVQVVFDDAAVVWGTARDVQEYIQRDKQVSMGFGDVLVRLGLVGGVFFLTVHHALFDGWSVVNVFQDVEREYLGMGGKQSVPHSVYVRYLAEQLDHEAAEKFWVEQFSGEKGVVTPASQFPQTLPAGYTPVPDSTATLSVSIPVTAMVPSGFTLPTRIRAAWALLVGRYLDQRVVVFGETFSGRASALPGIEQVAGPTIATAPVRVAWTEDETVGDLLKRVQQDVLACDGAGHAQVGIQAIAKTSPSAAEACQFRHLIVVQPPRAVLTPDGDDAGRAQIGLADAILDLEGYHSYALNMDFALGLANSEVTVTTAFDSSVFSPAQIDALQAQFAHVLTQLCRLPTSSPLSSVTYASPHDHQLQVSTNLAQPASTLPTPSTETTLLALLTQHVIATPTAPAVYAWDGSLSYRELDRGSSALAHHLSAVLGVRKGDYVPYCFNKSVWTTLSIVAILKMGAVAVAVEPSHPDVSVGKVLGLVRAGVVLCAPGSVSRIQGLGYRPFAVDENTIRTISQKANGGSTKRKKYGVLPSDTAFVVFTSGSTGEPKGIPLDHGAVCLMAEWHGSAMRITSSSRILQFAAHVFDVSIGDLAIALFHGACLCVPSEHDRLNNLAAGIAKLRANRAWLTPTVASLISPAECPTMEYLSVGGEQLTQTCKDIWAGVPLVNVYGPAEVTNLGTAVTITDHPLPLTNLGVGNGTRVWVCEPTNPSLLAPAGCIGELVIEGPNVTRGYLNNDTLTATSFVTIPSWIDGATPVRVYRTGDLARINPEDGTVDFQGRRDTQVKLRGQRLEMTAIETAVRAAVEEPVELAMDVLVREGGRDAFLLAFLFLPGRVNGAGPGGGSGAASGLGSGLFANMDISPLATSIREKLKTTLPPHMIPTLFIPLTSLPKLVSGKIDRKTLRAAAQNLTDAEIAVYQATAGSAQGPKGPKKQPTTQAERDMQGLWATALRLPAAEVGVEDNFVTLGGDSITAIRIVAQARAQGITISVGGIFAAGTIAKLVSSQPGSGSQSQIQTQPDAAQGQRTKLNHPQLPDIARQCAISETDIQDIYPTTALQDGLVMLTEQTPSAYVAHHVMDLPAWVDLTRFRQAWQSVVDGHAILRTRVVPSGLQAVLWPGPVQWVEGGSDLKGYIDSVRREKMGFGTALTRAGLLTNPPRFVLTAHHAVYDGWSMNLLAEALTAAYANPNPGSPTKEQLPFKSFIEHLQETPSSASASYWKSYLSGADPAPFPPSQSAPPSSPRADSILTKVVAFPRAANSTSTSSTLLRAAWAVLISAYASSAPDVIFGVSVTGRSVPVEGVLGMVGPALATVPVRVRVDFEDASATVKGLLETVQREGFDMMEFEQFGLQNIAALGGDEKRACELGSLVVIHPEASPATQKGGQKKLSWRNERTTSDFLTNPITLEATPMGGQVELVASYDSRILDEAQMGRMLSSLEHILQQICTGDVNPSLRLSTLDTTSPADRSELASITQQLPPLLPDRVHDMFARQAASTPSALAVSAWDGPWTYAELDELSSKLARHLQGLGVGPETFVPFAFEKSKWAGGACVPLDPAQPIDRLQSILGTLDARVAITSSKHAGLLTACPQVRHIVAVDQPLLDRLPRYGPPAIHPGTTPNTACYAIFTSGSTGTPKGVVWEHATLCSSMAEHGAAFHYSRPGNRVLQFSSHTFDVSVSELLTTLMFGGCVCIPDDFTRLNDITGFINLQRVTWAFFAPSFARLLDPAAIPGLQTVVLGGEAPGKDNIERWTGRDGLELIVTYGPAESCIYCAKNSVQSPATQIDGGIGRSIGGQMWVADLQRPTQLAPIGATGEIVVEGAILARGYLGDKEKTAASFRAMPIDWAGGRSERVYYTGDLGRVNSDGTISCLGRRDDQVKIRGQRVELPDIEYHLRKDDAVRQALVLYPRAGVCKDRLVGVLAMEGQDSNLAGTSGAQIALAEKDQWVGVGGVRERLSDKVPVYMVPAVWIVLDKIPLMPASQKVNKKMVAEWVKAMEKGVYETIAGLSGGLSGDAGASGDVQAVNTPLEEQVRGIWAAVLNVGPHTIHPGTSFLRLGGDSISAMQVVTRCRAEGVLVTVQDLLKAKTLAEFCQRASNSSGSGSGAVVDDKEDGNPFPLSPIQQWFLTLAPQAPGYFNQSHLLKVTSAVSAAQVQAALQQIVTRHAMLRARFSKSPSGWTQSITADAASSFTVREFSAVWSMQNVRDHAAQAQTSLDVSRGPVLAADLYSMVDGSVVLFITCHHLVIDLVSWRVVLEELETILKGGSLASHTPLSFRTWTRLLAEHSAATPSTLQIRPADFSFWGLDAADNTPSRLVEQTFTLDRQTTDLLMDRANTAFSTEPLDLLLTAVAHAFAQTFGTIRPALPAFFNEGHGREPWRSDIDISSTVGWFTSLVPVILSGSHSDVLRSLREVKDSRRQVPEKGLPWFSGFASSATTGVEITFNYFGLFQAFEKADALLTRATFATGQELPDSAGDVPRFSVFDVSAGVERGVMTMAFAFPERVKHRHLVQNWIDGCETVLRDLVRTTSRVRDKVLTLSDVPFFDTTYSELDTLLAKTLPALGITGEVQDLYPCSPMQTALLMSQALDPTLYAVRYVWEVVSHNGTAVSADKLATAWQVVIDTHPMLRTVFVQAAAASTYTQVVLTTVPASITTHHDATTFPVGRPHEHLGVSSKPPHHVVLLPRGNGSVLVQLDISHTLIDGTSVALLLDSFIAAYAGTVVVAPPQDVYAQYTGYLARQNLDSSRQFWRGFLRGCEPCQFPSLAPADTTTTSAGTTGTAKESARVLGHLNANYPNPAKLHSICAQTETTAASVYKLAWALLLRAYTGVESPCFGYLASGRDLPIAGIEKAVGPFIGMLVCFVTLSSQSQGGDEGTVEGVLKKVNQEYADCLEHQVVSLAEVQRGVAGLEGGERLFNTVVSVQRLSGIGGEGGKKGVEFREREGEDPSEFDIALNIGDAPTFVDLSLTYNTALLTPPQATALAATFTHTIDAILDSMTSPPTSLRLLTPSAASQITTWNTAPTTPLPSLADHLIAKHLTTRPHQPAIAGYDVSLTHAELDTLTTSIAAHLVSEYSVTPNTLVPFCFEKSSWAIIAMLSILKAGAAFVPLDPKHPIDRLVALARRVHAPLVICSESLEQTGLDIGGRLTIPYLLLGPNAVDNIRPVTGPLTPAGRTPDDLAYCLFTSGSTGTPKGVRISHAALSAGATRHGAYFHYLPASRVLQFASYVFDACITEILTTLIAGGCVCVPSEEIRMDVRGGGLAQFVRDQRVNHALLTPSVLAMLTPAEVPGIETLLLGGEAAAYGLIDAWRRARTANGAERRVMIAYGPTECTVICAGVDVSLSAPSANLLRPGMNVIGFPVASAAHLTMPDNPDVLAPVGAVGELCVAGPILAQGYLDDETKTAAAFVFPAWARGERVYRTGDLVRYREDGGMEYLGRKDGQVKVRGQRIELGEIEEQVAGCKEVQNGAVVLVKQGVCAGKLVGVVTLRAGSGKYVVVGRLEGGNGEGLDVLGGEAIKAAASKVGDAIGDVLPGFMVPSVWVVVGQLPLMASGKTDRRFLGGCLQGMSAEVYAACTGQAAPSTAASGTPSAGAATHSDTQSDGLTPVESTIRGVWAAVLNVPAHTINPDSGSFIKSGGDSISAMEVVAQCRGKGIPLLIEQLLKAKSVKLLAKNFKDLKLESETAQTSTSAGPAQGSSSTTMAAAEEDEEDDENITMFALSPIQRMFTRLSPGENHFNQSFLLKVAPTTTLDEPTLRRALDVVVKRHAMLRARFQKLGRTFKQWIEPTVDDSYLFRSWDLPPNPTFSDEALTQIRETQRTLDLENGPVFSGDLLNLGTDQYLFLTAHHLVIDLVSWRIILKDLEDYLVSGSITPYRSLSFEKWCTLLLARRKALSSTSTVPFPVAKPDYGYWSMQGKPNYAADFEHRQFTLSAETSAALLGGCNEKLGTEALDLFFAGVMQSFAVTFPDRAIPPVYNEGHGREPWDSSIDLSRTVGWFTTIAPVWVDKQQCAGGIVDYVKKTKEVRSQIPAKGFSYFSTLDVERVPFAIEVSFNYFGSFQQLDRPDALLRQVHFRNLGEHADPEEVGEGHKKFSLVDINAESEGGKLVFTFSFNGKMGKRAQVEQWMKAYEQSLEEIARVLGKSEPKSVGTGVSSILKPANTPSVPASLKPTVSFSGTGPEKNTGTTAGIPNTSVEAIYPCTPSQQGMLLTQTKDPDMYWFRSVYELSPAPSTSALRQAWTAVVARHPVLRTIFIEQDATDGLYDQLVLKEHDPAVIEDTIPPTHGSSSDDDLAESLKIRTVPGELLSRRAPQHQLLIARQPTTGRVFASWLLSHAIADGSSMGIILRDLTSVLEGRPLPLGKPLLQNYTDYVRSRDPAADIEFWKGALEGVEPCFLPVDSQPVHGQGHSRSYSQPQPQPQPVAELCKTELDLSGIPYAAIVSTARTCDASPFSLLQTVWALVLREFASPPPSRSSSTAAGSPFSTADKTESTFGIVTSGRDLPIANIGEIVGPLVNILVSRVKLEEGKTVAEVVEQVHEGFVDALGCQTVGLAEVVHEVGVNGVSGRGNGGSGLFNTGMTLQKAGGQGSEQQGGVEFRAMGGQDPTEFDLVVQALDTSTALRITFSYWTPKITPARASAMASVFTSFLSQIITNPHQPPASLDPTSASDLSQLWTWNHSVPAPLDIRIEEMIAHRTAENPDLDALWSSTDILTYGQLDLLSARIAQGVLSDVAREEIVPLCFEKSIWIVVAMLAVLKAGGTIVLMDPSHPLSRLRTIASTVRAKRVLCSPAQAELCQGPEGLDLPTVAISRDMFQRRSGLPGTAPRSFMSVSRKRKAKGSSDAAYVVFTSGSTGTPKGSVTEHKAFCTATQHYHQAIGQLPGSRVLQFASYSFDASFLEILGSLMVGATVCVPSEEERKSRLAEFINASSTSFAVITPTVASLLTPETVPSLRTLALCGEPMTTAHINVWADRCCVGPKCIGTAVSCCYWVVHPRNHDRLVRIGAYLHEPEKTAAAFLETAPEWARQHPGRATRLYKTGDLVVQNADGTFLYVGRKDTQAKFRGQRLELGDIEQAFRDVYPADTVVAEVVASDQPRIVLFFSARDGVAANFDPAAVQQKMADKIPAYMVPSVLTPLAELPRMPSGKVDRKKIKELGAALPTGPATQTSGRAPSSEMELAVADLWREVLKSAPPRLSVEDSFFHLVTAARGRGVVLSVASIMQAPKLGDMALKASSSTLSKTPALPGSQSTTPGSHPTLGSQQTQGSQGSPLVPPFSLLPTPPSQAHLAEAARQCSLPVSALVDLYPCTPLQEGLFVLSIRQAGAYVARHAYRLPANLDLTRYQAAWEQVYAADGNTILRTRIVQLEGVGKAKGAKGAKKGGLYQVVVDQPLNWQRATSLDAFHTPKPVALGTPLVEFAVVNSARERYLVLTMHHAAYDATSLGLLLSDVSAVYHGSAPAESRIPFHHFIATLQATPVESTTAFWTAYLANAQALTFPAIPRGHVPSADQNYERDVALPTPGTTATAVKGFTTSTLIRAAWALVLARHANTADVVFGETLSGRNGEGVLGGGEESEVQGPMITTLPVRVKIPLPSSPRGIQELLKRVQGDLVDVIPHQHHGLQNIRLVSQAAAAACSFACSVTIAPGGGPPGEGEGGLGLEMVEVGEEPVMSYPLSVQFILGQNENGPGAGGRELKVSVYYDGMLVEAGKVEQMVGEFGRVLTGLAASNEADGLASLERVFAVEQPGQEVGLGVEYVPGQQVQEDAGEGYGDGAYGKNVLDVLNEEDEGEEEEEEEEVGQGMSQPPADIDWEAEMKTLWADILGMEPDEISASDDFFQLGGDSIASMRLVTAAERRHIKLTVADIFQHPTLEELCDHAAATHVPAVAHTEGQGDGHEGGPVQAQIQEDEEYEPFGVMDILDLDADEVVHTVCRQLSVFPGDVEDVYPATDYQAWAISHGLMRSRGNTNYFLFRLHGLLDTFRLEQACRKMVACNPILRTLFTTLRGQVMQVVLRSYQIEFLRYGAEHTADDAFIRWLVEQDTQRSAHLSQSIVRFKLVLHADGYYVLIMRMSHAQYDGMCMPLLIQDLEHSYNGLDPDPRPSFGHFIQGATRREEKAIDFWGTLLDGSCMTEIVEHPGPAHKHNVDTIRTRTLPPIPVNVAGMSQATLVKAAWALVLAKMSSQRDIVFGNLIFGRNMPVPGVRDISGPCINIIPIRVKVNAMDSIHDLLRLVQEQQGAAMPHESLGFRRLIKNCTDWPHWTRFSSVVQHQQLGRDGSEGQTFQLADNLTCEMGVLGPAYDSADLWVQTTPMTDSFKVEIGSCSSVVQPAVAEMLLDKLCATLCIFAAISPGTGPHLWELLARDGAPVIPIKSSVVEQVWGNVLPDAEFIAWDTPYFDIWGDEIAPFDMEDILEHPTKQAMMMLTSRMMQSSQHRSRNGQRQNSARPPTAGTMPPTPQSFANPQSFGQSFGGQSFTNPGQSFPGSHAHQSFNGQSFGPPQAFGHDSHDMMMSAAAAMTSSHQSQQSAIATTNGRGFWMLDGSKKSQPQPSALHPHSHNTQYNNYPPSTAASVTNVTKRNRGASASTSRPPSAINSPYLGATRAGGGAPGAGTGVMPPRLGLGPRKGTAGTGTSNTLPTLASLAGRRTNTAALGSSSSALPTPDIHAAQNQNLQAAQGQGVQRSWTPGGTRQVSGSALGRTRSPYATAQQQAQGQIQSGSRPGTPSSAGSEHGHGHAHAHGGHGFGIGGGNTLSAPGHSLGTGGIQRPMTKSPGTALRGLKMPDYGRPQSQPQYGMHQQQGLQQQALAQQGLQQQQQQALGGYAQQYAQQYNQTHGHAQPPIHGQTQGGYNPLGHNHTQSPSPGLAQHSLGQSQYPTPLQTTGLQSNHSQHPPHSLLAPDDGPDGGEGDGEGVVGGRRRRRKV
ncbi:uncharacterized protein C8A04DRAFT_40942 [Dichotomopilus funicola]|uniref:Carrier domain-containing protein n=1 Tax=Dichotomopilus funicola TaxID=1934379 RepID=A0AAN6UTY3_9PEZI|nr:hypothetical protein C8A04DRAFT_40942 [Dichotomopilus funicola]